MSPSPESPIQSEPEPYFQGAGTGRFGSVDRLYPGGISDALGSRCFATSALMAGLSLTFLVRLSMIIGREPDLDASGYTFNNSWVGITMVVSLGSSSIPFGHGGRF